MKNYTLTQLSTHQWHMLIAKIYETYTSPKYWYTTSKLAPEQKAVYT